MAWNSLDEIIEEYELSSNRDDLEGLRSELLSKLVELHPDKTGGSFPSKETEEKYHRISSAIDFVSGLSQESKALIPISELIAIIKGFNEAQIIPKQTQMNTFRKEIRDENREALRTRYTISRISSGVFASICLALFTFSNALQQHPLMGPLLDNTISQITLLGLSVYAGMFFLLTWYIERKHEAALEFLLSEDGLRAIFYVLLEKGKRFTLIDVLDRIRLTNIGNYRRSASDIFSAPIGKPRMRSSVVEKIANMHLIELENRRVVHRLDIPSISPVYQVDENLTPLDPVE